MRLNKILSGLLVVSLFIVICLPSLVLAEPDPAKKVLETGEEPLHSLAKAITGFSVIIALILAGLALLILVTGVFPQFTEKVHTNHKLHHLRSFLLGLLNILFLFLLLTVSKGKLGIIVLPITIILITFGLVATSEDLGNRIIPLLNSKGTRFSRLTLGWIILALASLIPILGWFVIFPWRCLTGCGAFVLTIFSKAKDSSVAIAKEQAE